MYESADVSVRVLHHKEISEDKLQEVSGEVDYSFNDPMISDTEILEADLSSEDGLEGFGDVSYVKVRLRFVRNLSEDEVQEVLSEMDYEFIHECIRDTRIDDFELVACEHAPSFS